MSQQRRSRIDLGKLLLKCSRFCWFRRRLESRQLTCKSSGKCLQTSGRRPRLRRKRVPRTVLCRCGERCSPRLRLLRMCLYVAGESGIKFSQLLEGRCISAG